VTAEPAAAPSPPDDWGVTFHDVTVSWPGTYRQRYDGLTISFPALRGRLPILGRTGTGKSTLLYLLSAMKWPDSGTVTWCFPDTAGAPVCWRGQTRPKRPELARWHALRGARFGFSFQDGLLLPFLTVLENLQAPGRMRGLSPAQAAERGREILASVLIPSEAPDIIAGQHPGSLSGGQRQRVALGVAMAAEPDVIFADEPTGNLDPETRQEVMEKVLEWVDKAPRRRALVWVTHHEGDPRRHGAQQYLDVGAGVGDGGALETWRWRNA